MSAPTPRTVIERARPADLERVVRLLDEAALRQQSRGIDLWHPGTFEDEARATIDAGDLYVARQRGVIVGCFMLDKGSPRFMRWLSEHGRRPDRGVVGRLAVARDEARRGLGLELLREAGRLASQEGVRFLWLECPSDKGPPPLLRARGVHLLWRQRRVRTERGAVGVERVRAAYRFAGGVMRDLRCRW
jgi:ribosomal protein S18 acetylase RimI-like enzyme